MPKPQFPSPDMDTLSELLGTKVTSVSLELGGAVIFAVGPDGRDRAIRIECGPGGRVAVKHRSEI